MTKFLVRMNNQGDVYDVLVTAMHLAQAMNFAERKFQGKAIGGTRA